MARCDHLKVWKDTYELIKYFYQISQGFPRSIKYGLVADINQQLMLLIEQIIRANSSDDKKAHIAEAIIVTELIKIKIRLLRDLKHINAQRYELLNEKLITVAKQLTAWKKWHQAGG